MRRPVVLAVALSLLLGGLAVVAHAQDGQARSVDLACPPLVVPAAGFADVPDGAVHQREIDCIAWWEVARGTSASTYSSASPVTRAQMASFIANLVTKSDGTLPESSVDHFGDDGTSVHKGNINRLAEAGIVSGKGGGVYDPNEAVTRAQMATFLVTAYEYRTGQALSSSRDYFDDDGTSVHRGNINKAAEAGFTGGTAAGTYSPGANVTRAAMASFLARVIDRLVEEGFATPPLAEDPTSEPTEGTTEASSEAEECDPLDLDCSLDEPTELPTLPTEEPTESPPLPIELPTLPLP